ncbi:MAG: DUF433 domain-containing protein [Acidobacteriota bacterium]|nr:DUF433 domain-containing protein [Acidobacteriota bacterium]
MGGVPCVRHLRIPVAPVFDHWAEGERSACASCHLLLPRLSSIITAVPSRSNASKSIRSSTFGDGRDPHLTGTDADQ